MDWWQNIVIVAIAALAAAATGLLRTDPQDNSFVDFWAPELRTKKRLVLAAIHAVVGAVGAAAAMGLDWVPSKSDPWWVANGLIYAGAAVAVFRADVSGFKLGTATTGRSLLKLVEDRTRNDVARGTSRNIGILVESAKDARLVATAYTVLQHNYTKSGVKQVGYRELTKDISDAADVLDPAVTLNPAPNPEELRAWLRELIVDGIESKQLLLRGHHSWVEARDLWAQD